MESKSASYRLAPILLYIPVLHNGYLKFFDRYPENKELWLVGEDLAAEFSTLHTEIRAVNSRQMSRILYSLHRFSRIRVLERQLVCLDTPSGIITASERVSQEVCKKYFPQARVTCDTVFLRYDESNVKTLDPVRYDRISEDPFDIEMMRVAVCEGEKSSDWWRHVGAKFVKNGKVVATAHNQPVPYEQMPYIFGNPRDFIQAGTLSEYSDVLHSEKVVCLKAWRRGILPDGADLYVSVFPCPDCAKFVAYSGIKRVFFGSGHASLDGERVLHACGVELVYVPIRPLT